MTSDNEQEKLEPRVLRAEPGLYTLTGSSVDLLVAANLAERWFADLVREAERGTEDATDSIRREVVLAVCFAESYIFEWARKLMGQDAVHYFRLEPRFEDVKERWKRVPVDLHEAEILETASKPDINWGEMGEVTRYRNGLVHGRASIPRGSKSEEGKPREPVPRLSELQRRGQGWALNAVLKVLEQLHHQTDTPVPDYLQGYVASV